MNRSFLAVGAGCVIAVLACSGAEGGIVWPVDQGGNGHSYQLVVNNTITWSQAVSAAAADGGYLATITSAAENQFIDNLLSGQSAPTGSYWIGLTRISPTNTPTGSFKWITGEPLVFTNWSPGVPDNFKGVEDSGSVLWTASTSVATASRRGHWNDLPNIGYPSQYQSFAGTDLARGGYLIEFNSGTGGSSGPTSSPSGSAVPLPSAAWLFAPCAVLALAASRRVSRGFRLC